MRSRWAAVGANVGLVSGDRAVRVLVLGPCGLEVDGRRLALTATQRLLLARLAVTPRHAVPLAALVEALWGAHPPRSARTAVHNQVSRLRAAAGRDLIQTTADGYQLLAHTDVEELVRTVWQAERVLAQDPARALDLLDRARELGGGEPFADLADCTATAGIRREVATVLDSVDDLEVEAALALGLVVRALATAVRLRGETPHDEARAARLARAYELAGRRGDALGEVARLRRDLRTGLGIEPSGPILALEAELHGAPEPDDRSPALTPAVDTVLGHLDEGRSVLVVGPHGSGVSALMHSLRARLSGRGSAVASARVQGYRDVAVAVLLDLLDELGVESSPALGPVGSFVPAVSEVAASRPVVLLVDDADLAGPSSERALAAVADLPEVRLVLGAHHDPGGYAGLARVHVHDGVGDDLASLRRVVRAEPPEVQRALVAAAVMGADAPVEVFGVLGAEDGLRQALQSGVLVQQAPAGSIGFAQVRMRDAVLAEAPVGLREEMHHTLGRSLLDRGAAVDAARHLIAAPAIEPRVTLRAARQAAAAARASGAHHDAADWLRQGLAATEGRVAEADRLRLLTELGDVLRLAGAAEHIDILVAAVEAAVRLGDDELLGEALFALLQLGGTTVSTTLDAGLQGLLRRGMSLLRDPEQVAVVKGAASLAYSMTGNAERSRRLFLEAERGARSDRVRMRVLPFAYLALGMPGDLDRRAAIGQELIALGRAHGDAVAEFEGLHVSFSAQVQAAAGARLRATLDRMTELIDRVGDVGRRWALLYLSAGLAHLEGDLAAAERIAATAHDQLAPVAESRATAALYGQLFGLALARGTVGELTPFVTGLVADQQGVPAWHAVAALCLVESDPAGALDHARRAVAAAEPDFTWLAAHVVAGRAAALVAAGDGSASDPGLLDDIATRLAPYSGQATWQGTCSYGPVDTTLALIARARGDRDRARSLAARAAAQATSLRAPVFLADLDRLGLGTGGQAT